MDAPPLTTERDSQQNYSDDTTLRYTLYRFVALAFTHGIIVAAPPGAPVRLVSFSSRRFRYCTHAEAHVVPRIHTC